MLNKRTKLSELIKNAFKVEALEPRILLSGDPVFGAAQVANTGVFEADGPLDAFAEQYTLSSFKELNDASQQTSGYDRPEADDDFVVDDIAFDMANITTDMYTSGGNLIIGDTETLGGSGSVNLNVTNFGELSPGYSPGIENLDSLTNTDSSTITIELAGLTAGSEYDQINVANNLVFDGALSIELLNGFIPEVGDKFSIMTYGSSAGSFDSISGLTISGTDLYFDIEQDENELRLVTKSIDSGSTFLSEILGSEQQNTYGELLNIDYFNSTSSYDFNGSLAFSGFEIDGDISVTYDLNYSLSDPQGTQTDFSLWNLSVTDADATFAIDDIFTLELSDFDLGLSYLVTDNLGDDRSWVFATGMAASANSGLTDSVSFQATDLGFDFSQALHDSSDELLNLSINPISVGDFTLDNADSESSLQLYGQAALDIAGQTLSSDVNMTINPSTMDEIRLDIEDGELELAAGAGSTGLAVGVDDLHGAILLDRKGIAGVLQADELSLTQLDGSALPGLDVNEIRSVSVGFNTTGEAVTETLGNTYIDYSDSKFHDFFAINANLDLGLSVEGAVAYNISGQFGFTKTEMEIVTDEPAQDVILMSVLDGETSLTVGSEPGGAMVKLSGLQGAGLITNIDNQFGAVGMMTVGSVALTEADGITPLIADLSMMPLNLPFNFNLFDLDPSLDLSLNLPDIDLTLASFPYIDLSAPGLPSLNLPDLDLAAVLPNVDLPDLSLPELGFALPSLDLPNIDISFPEVDLGWPYLSLAELTLAYPELGLTFESLTFPQLMFALPRLNLPALEFEFDIEGLDPNWPDMSWPDLTAHLATLDLPWPDVAWADFDFDAIRAALPDLDLPDLDFAWADMKLPDLLLAIKMLELPSMSISFPDISLSWPSFDVAFPDWPDVGLPDMELGDFIFALDALNLPGLDINFPDLSVGWPDISLPEFSAAFPDLNIDWPNLTLPELMFALPSLDLAGLDFNFDLPGLDADWPNMTWPELQLHLEGLDINWPDVSLSELAIEFPELNLDWENINLADLIFALPKLDLTGFSLDFDLPVLGLDWADITLSNLGVDFPDLDIDWASLSLPEFIMALPELNLPNLDLSIFDINLPDFAFPELSVESIGLDFDLSELGFSIYGEVDFQLADVFQASGNLGFSKINDEIIVLGDDVLTLFGIGDFLAGVTDGDLALLIKSDSTVVMDIAGDLVLEGAGFITDTIWADSARFQYNTSLIDYSGDNSRTLTVGDISKDLTMAAGAAGSPLMALSIYGFSAEIEGAVGLSGDFSLTRKTESDGTRVMMMTGQDVMAYLGTDDMSASLSNADLAMAIFEIDATTTTYAVYALGDAALVGVTDVTLSGTFQLLYNRTGMQIVDFGGDFGEIDYGTTADFTAIRAASLNVNVAGFFAVDGAFAIEKTTTTVTLSDGRDVEVDLLTLGTSQVSAFAGVNAGSDDALGFDLTGADMALALMTDSGNAQRKWMTLQSSVASAAFVGVDGLTVATETLNVEINRNLSTSGDPVAQPDLLLDTVLALQTDLTVGELVFNYMGQQALVAVALTHSNANIRNEIQNKLEKLLTDAGVANATGNVNVNGSLATGFTFTFSGDLSGQDFSAISVTALTPEVTTQLVEVTKGEAAYDNVTLEAVSQNAQYRLNTDVTDGVLTLGFDQQSADINVTADMSDAQLLSAIVSVYESFTGIGAGNVSVTGDRSSGYVIEFVGALAGKAVDNLSVSLTLPSPTVSSITLIDGEEKVTGYNTTGTNISEKQRIDFSNATKSFADYRLKIGDITTAEIDFSKSSPTQNVKTLQNALDAALGKNKVKVSFDQSSTTASPSYFVRFIGQMAYQDIAAIEVVSADSVTVSVATVQEGSSATKTEIRESVAEVQELRLDTTSTAELSLSFTIDGKSYTTEKLGFAASSSQIESALLAAVATDYATATFDVTVSSNKWSIDFSGALNGKNIGALKADVTAVTGQASIERLQEGLVRDVATTVTTEAVNETQQLSIQTEAQGSYTLSLDYLGQTYTTAAIDFADGSYEIKQTLLAALASIDNADVQVIGEGEGIYNITFKGGLAGVDLSMLSVVVQRA